MTRWILLSLMGLGCLHCIVGPSEAAPRWGTLAHHDPAPAAAPLAFVTRHAGELGPAAQLALGKATLLGGPARPRDARRAAELFRAIAASPGPSRAEAAHALGLLALGSELGAANPEDAVRWFAIAADDGSLGAMFLLANAYRAGDGAPRDDARAVRWYTQAGERDHAPSLQALALAYHYGELGLAPDDDEARRYEMEAAHAVEHCSAP